MFAMNKTFKKAIACTMAVGTLVAGGNIALNAPAKADSYSKTESYYFCNNKHAYAQLSNVYKQNGTLTLKASGKTYTYKYQVKSDKESKRKKVGNTYQSTKNVYLWINGKRSVLMQTYTYTYKNATTKSYLSSNVRRYNFKKVTNVGSNFAVAYSYNTSGVSTLEIEQNKCSAKCKTCFTNVSYRLENKGFSNESKKYTRSHKVSLGNGYYLTYAIQRVFNKKSYNYEYASTATLTQTSKNSKTHNHTINQIFTEVSSTNKALQETGITFTGKSKNSKAVYTATEAILKNNKKTIKTKYSIPNKNSSRTTSDFYNCSACALKMDLFNNTITVKAPGKSLKTYYTKLK